MKNVLLYIGLIALGAFLWWALSSQVFDSEPQDGTDPGTEARLRMQQEADDRRATDNAESETDENNEQNTEPRPPAGTGTYVQGPFEIQGTSDHPASGQVEIIHSQGEKLVRFNSYDGPNGQDLHVYLATDLEATEYIDLGETKNESDTSVYGMPLDADLTEYSYILTWSESEDTLYNYAQIY